MTLNNSYNKKIIIISVIFILCLFSLVFVVLNIKTEKIYDSINCSEKEVIKGNIYLKNNDFIDADYLEIEKNKPYIANMISKINLNFLYYFLIDEEVDINYSYDIKANLVIANNLGVNYINKEFTLLEKKNSNISKNKYFSIDENIDIDYQYYNALSEQFNVNYGLDTTNYLEVYLTINKEPGNDVNYNINKENKLLLRIPLSEKAIEITLDSLEKTNTYSVEPNMMEKVIYNKLYIIIGIVLSIVTISLFVILIILVKKMTDNKTAYDKYVSKLLKEYDRLIVETHSNINFTGCNVISVDSFSELLDVRDNFKVPIVYLNLIQHLKGIFYIKNGIDVYQYILEDKDLNKK